jgi:hypothetical protein
MRVIGRNGRQRLIPLFMSLRCSKRRLPISAQTETIQRKTSGGPYFAFEYILRTSSKMADNCSLEAPHKFRTI